MFQYVNFFSFISLLFQPIFQQIFLSLFLLLLFCISKINFTLYPLNEKLLYFFIIYFLFLIYFLMLFFSFTFVVLNFIYLFTFSKKKQNKKLYFVFEFFQYILFSQFYSFFLFSVEGFVSVIFTSYYFNINFNFLIYFVVLIQDVFEIIFENVLINVCRSNSFT